MKFSTNNYLTLIKQIIMGGGNNSAGDPANDAGFLKRAEGISLASFLPTNLTDSTTGTPGSSLAAGTGVFTLTIPHTLETGTGAGEVITAYTPGYAFKILAWSFTTDVPGVGSSASRVFNMEIGTVDVGTVASTITLTEASTSAKGEQTAGTAVSGANTGTASDTFSIEVASGGTGFTAGSGTFTVKIQNMDTANAVASLAAQAGLVADETNARVIKVEEAVDTIGNIVFNIPRDYDEATDVLVLRVLASQLTVSTDDDVQLDSELYKKRAGEALSADLAPAAPSTVLSTTEQWIEFDYSGNSFQRDDVAIIELLTDGHNDTTGEEVLIHAVELVYRSTVVSYDETDGANNSTGNPLR